MADTNVKTIRQLLPSAARTATTASAKQTDYRGMGVRVYFNVTAGSGGLGMTPQIRGYNKSGTTALLLVAPVAITGPGIYVYEMVAGATSAASGDVKASISRPLPLTWDVNISHSDATSFTYDVSAEVFPF